MVDCDSVGCIHCLRKLEIELQLDFRFKMTEIQKFYKNKNIFLTGGTGFLGKVFIEKVLRVTEVNRIFVLTRDKKGKSIKERISDVFDDALFEKLKKLKPQALERVIPISGDCALPNLGLTAQDVEYLMENTDIVVHSAATVRFNEPLSTAVAINVRATMDLLQLAKKMKNLMAFVHVSSAFANCLDDHIEERFYAEKLTVTAKQICAMSDILGTDTMNSLSKELCKKFPNTYCFTKALAEEAVFSENDNLPVCIFRPGIVVPTCNEPIPGWIDNLYGPTSILYGVAHGVLRVLYVDIETNSSIVPVDFCANTMLAAAWQIAKNKMENRISAEPPIYNLVPDERNIVTWKSYKTTVEKYGFEMPPTKMLWFPFLLTTKSIIAFRILCFIYHTMPGYFLDFCLLLSGRKVKMTKIYRKIQNQTLLLRHFVEQNFTFTTENTQNLWKSLSAEDQDMFQFDVLSIDWPSYFYNSLYGMRRFLGKEEPDTIPSGLNLLKRLYFLHRGLQCLICGGGLSLLFWTLSKVFKL